MVVLQPRQGGLLPFLAIMGQAVAANILLFYALVWKAGDLLELPDLRIGFYNFCLLDEATDKLRCYKGPELATWGVSWVSLALARLGVYGALVLTLFAPLPLLLSRCKGDQGEWQLARGFLVASLVLLAGGLSFFLASMWQWLQLSLLGPAFLALCMAQGLLLLLLAAIRAFPQGVLRKEDAPETC
ncbi:transmembrane protein 140 [Echinops telfairi]|uniref:Transmembrane protein 140 n=1 Tax=Echinops telfairi TaxID=9371 RepID=A0ABM0IUC9_ECHTE|nr:transmembrane protein 140 [Echinops telfairi]